VIIYLSSALQCEPDDPKEEEGYRTMIFKTTEDSSRESVMEDVKGQIVG